MQDGQSGVTFVQVQLYSSLSQQWVQTDATLMSGNAADGDYRAELVLPKGSMSGTWNACVWVRDAIGNLDALQWMELDLRFGAGAGEVTNDAAVCDSTAPQATAVSVSPAHVDTSAAAQTVTVSVTVGDDLSGVSGATAWLYSTKGYQSRWVALSRISGDEASGEYRGTTTLPRYAASGEWRVNFSAQDALGNGSTPVDLAGLFGADAIVTNDAAVDDTTPPQLTALSVTPAVFDTESGDQTLTVSVRATDDLAGLSSVGVYIDPMLSDQMHYVFLDPAPGDKSGGVLSGTITLPQGAEVGPWRTRIETYDVLGNHAWYLPDQLAALLPGATGITLVNTAAAQQVTIRKDWILTGADSTVTFPAGTVVTRSEGGSFAFYRMVAQPFELTADVPTDQLLGDPVATLRFGIPGLDLSFSQPVSVCMRVGGQYDGYLVRIQSLTEGGDAWADETEALVGGGVAQFTVNHATRFVAETAKARVTKVTPRRCRRRGRVTIVGLGFGNARGRSTVFLGGKACRTYKEWGPRAVTFVVPRGARLARLRLKVRVNGAFTQAGRLKVRR